MKLIPPPPQIPKSITIEFTPQEFHDIIISVLTRTNGDYDSDALNKEIARNYKPSLGEKPAGPYATFNIYSVRDQLLELDKTLYGK